MFLCLAERTPLTRICAMGRRGQSMADLLVLDLIVGLRATWLFCLVLVLAMGVRLVRGVWLQRYGSLYLTNVSTVSGQYGLM